MQHPYPRVGMLAMVRNKTGVITSVTPFDSNENGRIHLVELEYTDTDGQDRLIWEREVNPIVTEPTALPKVSDFSAMNNDDFNALVRACRWTALTPLDYNKKLLPLAPFFGAIQVEDFQLVPLYQALQMPRVNLMLADDVGLGKTIEAGLIISELLSRKRIRRILILCPASLRYQWKQEMKDKFSLNFDIVDREESFSLQKKMGLDANPWRSFPKIITSYHYLRQPDVLEQFRSASPLDSNSPHLPWDLIVVDEAHNLMPSHFGNDSDLCQMLRTISPWFEHRLFLTATPHNGYTRCFSGLLQILDPLRFTQKSEFDNKDHRYIEQVVIRRLKREIHTENGQNRFSTRNLHPISLDFHKSELALLNAFEDFRKKTRQIVSEKSDKEISAGNFGLSVLNKRLLSCPFTFANSWYRYQEGIIESNEANISDIAAAEKSLNQEIDDDLELESRLDHTANIIGMWMKPLNSYLEKEVLSINNALNDLGLEKQGNFPKKDSRWDSIVEFISQKLRTQKAWKKDEKLVIFTEYKTTLDYISQRLIQLYPEEDIVLQLYGGMKDEQRNEIKEAFNDSDSNVRILVATDAASEGLNLQETSRYIFHWDIPWNPSRMEQRNGRLDRHGQARDVEVLYFTSEQNSDIKFLAHVINKVNNIREDLGSMGKVFDRALESRFSQDEDGDFLCQEIDRSAGYIKKQGKLPKRQGKKYLQQLKNFSCDIDLSPQSLQETLEVALGKKLQNNNDKSTTLQMPISNEWQHIVDTSLRFQQGKHRGALRGLVFDPNYFVQKVNNRPVFRPKKDLALMHLGHPLLHHSINHLTQLRYPGKDNTCSCWNVKRGKTLQNIVIVLHVEELVINELREPIHHWVNSLYFAYKNNSLFPIEKLDSTDFEVAHDLISEAQKLWDDTEIELLAALKEYKKNFENEMDKKLQELSKKTIKEETEKFRSRLSEITKEITKNTTAKIKEEQEKLAAESKQQFLFAEMADDLKRKIKELEKEASYRKTHLVQLRELIQSERQRSIKHTLPKRYSLKQVQVLPIAVEICFPEETK